MKRHPALSLVLVFAFTVASSAQRIDSSWTLTVGGQSVTVSSNGTFRIPNVSAPDAFGEGGPGSRPDFVSDDYLRLTGSGIVRGKQTYVFSEFFRLTQGRVVGIDGLKLTFTEIPPRKPESLTIICTNRILRVGEPRQLEVLARFADGTTTNVAPRTFWTSYRISNPNIATISPDGLVTPHRPGIIYITAINEGASAVCGLNVISGPIDLTTVTGTVVDANGLPVAGSTIYFYDLELNPITTGADGRFSVASVPSLLGPLKISVRATVNGRPARAFLRIDAVSGGTTALGSVVVSQPESPLRRVVAGSLHTVALREDGTLWTWGNNSSGQLGYGTFNNTNFPQAILTNMTWRGVSARSSHTVALRADSTLWAWGANGSGQLGNGTNRNANTPQPIQSNVMWRAVAAGNGHTVGVREDGTLWAWGANNYGQLGNGTFTSTNVPRPILTNSLWLVVAAGGSHTVAVHEDGTLWTWGRNTYGQLGTGVFSSSGPPGPILTNWVWREVSVGENHTVALREDGALWAWGLNGFGQVGNGGFFDANTPQRIATNQTWQSAAAGGHLTVALRDDGTLWAWGQNGYGELDNRAFVNSPQQILLGGAWRAVAAGGIGSSTGGSIGNHAVALREDGSLWAWGRNDYGQLGNTLTNSMNTPQPVLSNATWQAVTAGYAHTAAIREDGTLEAWGANYSGQLGNGSLTSANTPQPIIGNARWQAVAAGGNLDGGHTVALRDDGSLWAWGTNGYGQLGIGTNGLGMFTNSPQPIVTNETWQGIAAGGYHSMALRHDGIIWAWGWNASGQLGNNTTNNMSTPQPIVTNVTWRQIAAGFAHTVALREDGTLWTWGDNTSGQLGNGTLTNANTPQPILTNMTWRTVTARSSHTVALREDGRLWVCGANFSGQLGEVPARVVTPLPILTNLAWQAVSTGGDHTLAIREDGTLWTWGANNYGQLGNGTITFGSTKTPQPIMTNATWRAVAAGFSHSAAIRDDGTLWAWGFNEYGQIAQPVPWLPNPVLGGAVWGLPRP